MILQESKTVPIAGADWTDDGEVELSVFTPAGRQSVCMLPETARALIQRLTDAAREAEKAAGESGVQRGHRAVRHGFDVDLGYMTPEEARAALGIRPEVQP